VPKTWAISGVDLHLDLTGTRVRAGLEAALRNAVSDGRLRPGTRLPSSRSLAADLGVARNTVAEAYGQLVAEGWLAAAQGSGTRVAERPSTTVARAASPPPQRPPRYDLRAGSPDLSAFPRSAWLSAARRALNQASYEAFGYSDPRGRPELRSALAEYLARARGVRCDPDGIIICSGFAQSFRLLCDVLTRRGAHRLALEQFVEPTTHAVSAASALNVRRLPIDDAGAATADLDGDDDAVVLTAAHQFAVGVPLARHRRAEVIAWAHETGGLIIEDDYDGEFRYDRHPIGALQSLAPEHVVYAGTASKALAPGLRLGWMVPPAHMMDEIAAAKTVADRNTSAIDQLTLAEFIASGGYDRHVRRARLSYRRRRDRLVATLRRRVPDAEISGIAAGLHALVKLPAGMAEDMALKRAAERGVAITGRRKFAAPDDAPPPALLVGYATPPAHAFTGAVARLCAALGE
jgi:GntR family transcriptional regulator / MocR family aminotransferase